MSSQVDLSVPLLWLCLEIKSLKRQLGSQDVTEWTQSPGHGLRRKSGDQWPQREMTPSASQAEGLAPGLASWSSGGTDWGHPNLGFQPAEL